MSSHIGAALCLLLVGLPFPLQAAGASSLRQRLLRYALKHNRSLRAFRAGVRGARARSRGLRAFPNNPVLTGSGGVQLPLLSGATVGLLPRVGVGLSWALPIGGRWGKRQRLARSRLKQLQDQLKIREFHLSLSLHHRINQLAIARRMERKRKAMAAFFQKLSGLTRQRIKHGAATQLDLQLAESSRLQAQQAALLARLHAATVRQQLQTLMGWSGSSPWKWKGFAVPAFAPVPSQKQLSQALKSHVMLRAATAAVARAKAAAALARAQAIPDLTIQFAYSLEDNNHVFRGAVSIPLPLFWRNQSQIGLGRARLRRARLRLARERFALRQKLGRAHLRYKTHLKLIQLLQKRLSSVQARSRLIERGLRQGSFSMFQVLTTQRSILQLQLSYLRNIKKAHHSYIQLCHAAGLAPAYPGVLRR